ncbi:MAG: FAD-dependent oxidoreductase, partial [Anaerolineae bacterium]|nr:FAD-dependent oxidoreductase [Anaerolineae bacterium]
PWSHGGRTLPADFDLFDPLMDGAIRRIPFLEQAEVVSLICHPGAYTPDCYPILGPLPGARGLWMAAGMSLNGFGGAGGMGKLMAEWIVTGEPSLDVYSFRATRFGNYFDSPTYAAERTKESVRYYYRLKFPNDERELARPHRLSPVHSRLQEQGAVFGEKFGWERVNYFKPGRAWKRAGADQHEWGWGKPPYFERVGQEHQAVRERVALFDLSSFGKIEVSDAGALTLLQRLADSDLDKAVGSVIYTQFLNQNGGVIADLTITRLAEDRFRVVTGSSFIANDLAWIKMHIQPDDDDVEIRDITLDLACLALWGPKARKVLAEVSADDVSNQAFPYLHSTTITIRGAEVLAQRVSYVGELGWELYVSPERAVQVWDALMAAGQAHEIEVGGYKALDSLRLEKGYRYYTADVTPLENPYEAGLGFCVKLNKGDFLGKEALLKAKEAGIDKKLCTLTLDGDGFIPIYGGEAITLENKVVSRVRSGGYGYTLKKNIILAYLPSELAKTGNRFQVEVFDERIGAEVTPVVLYDSKNEKIRA